MYTIYRHEWVYVNVYISIRSVMSFGEFSFIVSIKNVRATCQSSFSSRLQSKERAKHRLRVEGTRRGTYVGPNRTIGRRGKRIKADIACTGLDKDRFPLDYEALAHGIHAYGGPRA